MVKGGKSTNIRASMRLTRLKFAKSHLLEEQYMKRLGLSSLYTCSQDVLQAMMPIWKKPCLFQRRLQFAGLSRFQLAR